MQISRFPAKSAAAETIFGVSFDSLVSGSVGFLLRSFASFIAYFSACTRPNMVLLLRLDVNKSCCLELLSKSVQESGEKKPFLVVNRFGAVRISLLRSRII